MPSPMLKTRPVSSKLALGAEPKILSSKMEEISAEADALAWVGADVDNFWAKTPMDAACLPTWKKMLNMNKKATRKFKKISSSNL